MKTMAKKCKSWQEKLVDSKGLPKVEKITPKMAGKWRTKVGDTVVIPAPMEVNEIMKKVPEGKLITINDIRTTLAQKKLLEEEGHKVIQKVKNM
jgi:hypothetical protein